MLTSGSRDEGLQQSFPLGAHLHATLWLHLQVPVDQEPGLAPRGGELLAGPGLGGSGGWDRREACRRGAALLGPGLAWRGGFGSPGSRGPGGGVEALAKRRATFGGGGGAVGRGRSWAAGDTQGDGDPGSDGRMVQGVGALHRRAALGRITQGER